jgi:FkbM family methyltransferase
MAFDQHTAVIKKLCPNARVIFDVGACIGAFSKQFLLNWPKARVYAFEPDNRCIKKLGEMRLDRFHVVKKCVGKGPGRVMFNAHSSDLSIGTMKKPFRPLDEFRQVEVDLVSIDDFCKANRVKTVDIIKIDTQGGELDALRGAATTLDTVEVVVVELMFHEHCISVSPWWEIPKLLHRHGLHLYWLFSAYKKISGGEERIAFADAVFSRREFS